jgi:hypothetical protein
MRERSHIIATAALYGVCLHEGGDLFEWIDPLVLEYMIAAQATTWPFESRDASLGGEWGFHTVVRAHFAVKIGTQCNP